MSRTDFRRLIDLHGGNYIAIECSDGVTIEIRVNGETPLKTTADIITTNIIPRLEDRMKATLTDGFKRFEFAFGRTSTELNYYDAGQLLDTLRDAVKFIA